MKFLADMGVSLRVVEWLRLQGHDAVHLRDEGLQRSQDKAIFDKASSEKRVILTFDLDFAEILALSGDHTVTAIIFRFNNATPPYVIERLGKVLSDVESYLGRGSIIVIEDARHRIRRLPLGS